MIGGDVPPECALFAIIILKASGVVLISLDLVSDTDHPRDDPCPTGNSYTFEGYSHDGDIVMMVTYSW